MKLSLEGTPLSEDFPQRSLLRVFNKACRLMKTYMSNNKLYESEDSPEIRKPNTENSRVSDMRETTAGEKKLLLNLCHYLILISNELQG